MEERIAYAAVLVDGAAGSGAATMDWRLELERERRTVFMRLRYLDKPSGLSSPGRPAVSCGDMTRGNLGTGTYAIGEWCKNAMVNARSQIDVNVD